MSEMVPALAENIEEIKKAIHSLGAAGIRITMGAITKQLTDYIVGKYDGVTSLFIYKSKWCNDITNVLTSMNISNKKGRVDWEKIAMMIHDRRLGIVNHITHNFSGRAAESTQTNSKEIGELTETNT